MILTSIDWNFPDGSDVTFTITDRQMIQSRHSPSLRGTELTFYLGQQDPMDFLHQLVESCLNMMAHEPGSLYKPVYAALKNLHPSEFYESTARDITNMRVINEHKRD